MTIKKNQPARKRSHCAKSASQRGGNRSFRELVREHNLKPISDERFRENMRSVAQRRAR